MDREGWRGIERVIDGREGDRDKDRETKRGVGGRQMEIKWKRHREP
jgi:hypothetical protein